MNLLPLIPFIAIYLALALLVFGLLAAGLWRNSSGRGRGLG